MVLCPHAGTGLRVRWTLRLRPRYCFHSCMRSHPKPLRRRRPLMILRRLRRNALLVVLGASYMRSPSCPIHLLPFRLQQGACRNSYSGAIALLQKILSPDLYSVDGTDGTHRPRNNLILNGVAIGSLLQINLKGEACVIN